MSKKKLMGMSVVTLLLLIAAVVVIYVISSKIGASDENQSNTVAADTADTITTTAGYDGSDSTEQDVADQAAEDQYVGGNAVDAVITPITTPAPAVRSEQIVEFSLSDNFYYEDAELELSSTAGNRIFYTTDGSVPSVSKTEYDKPIILKASSSSPKVYTISACVYYADGTVSTPCIRTYFVGTKLTERYDTLVVCVTTDPYNLFDYEYGIFTPGKILDDYVALHPGEEINGGTPANYQMRGDESERPVYVEIYNSDGSLVLEQNAGIRTYGGWSRANGQTPFKLFARKEYGETSNKFRYPFFTDAFDEKGEFIDSFKRLVVRSCGNDNSFAFIREELFQTLAKTAGYEAKSVRPCAVYINGEYYGEYWLTEVYHDSYFEAHYGKYDGEIRILEGDEFTKLVDDENEAAVKDYQEMYDIYAYSDLTDEAVYKELCEKIDVQNYLEYYAFQIFIGNVDWPQNNYKVYRYYAAEGEQYKTGAPYDGKWRYLLHDMDYSTGIYGESILDRFISYYLNKDGTIEDEVCPLFGALMQREDCRTVYLTKALDLINGVFAETYFNSVLDEMNALRMNEMSYTYFSGKLAGWVAADQLDDQIASLKEYVKGRGYYAYNEYYNFFDLDGLKYTLDVYASEGCSVSINSFETAGDFTGKYYSDIDTVITTNIENGQEFDYWLINGTIKNFEQELHITTDMINGTHVSVSIVTK